MMMLNMQPNVQGVSKNPNMASNPEQKYEMPKFLLMSEMFGSKYGLSPNAHYSFHCSSDESTDDEGKKGYDLKTHPATPLLKSPILRYIDEATRDDPMCNEFDVDNCDLLKKKCNSMKEDDCFQFTSKKRSNDEFTTISKKKKFTIREHVKKVPHTRKYIFCNTSESSKPKFVLPIFVEDPAYSSLIYTKKYFTANQKLKPKYYIILYNNIIRPDSKMKLPLEELRDLFCIFSQHKYLEEFFMFIKYFLK